MSDGTCPRTAPSSSTAGATAPAISVSASFRSVGPLLVPPEAVASYPAPAAEGRGWKYSGRVNGWPMSALPTTRPLRRDQAAVRLPGEEQLREAGHHAGIDQAGEHAEQQRQDERGTEMVRGCMAQTSPRAVRTTSISLMPANGHERPPTP